MGRNIVRLANIEAVDQLYEIYSHKSVSPNMWFDPCYREEFSEIFDKLLFGGDLVVGTSGSEL